MTSNENELKSHRVIDLSDDWVQMPVIINKGKVYLEMEYAKQMYNKSQGESYEEDSSIE